MSTGTPPRAGLFDEWPDRYDDWFTTPIGRLVKQYETEILISMLNPLPEESILDVGCGTGVFTKDVLISGARVTGIDISRPMLQQAARKTASQSFLGVVGDMVALPFAENSFDKVYSMTAVEFVGDAVKAVAELDRVVRPGGTVVLTTLNALSPWAKRRREKAEKGHTLFQNMTFRSPVELAGLVPGDPTIRTAIHFQKGDEPQEVPEIEKRGNLQKKDTGAFVALAWRKSVSGS